MEWKFHFVTKPMDSKHFLKSKQKGWEQTSFSFDSLCITLSSEVYNLQEFFSEQQQTYHDRYVLLCIAFSKKNRIQPAAPHLISNFLSIFFDKLQQVAEPCTLSLTVLSTISIPYIHISRGSATILMHDSTQLRVG